MRDYIKPYIEEEEIEIEDICAVSGRDTLAAYEDETDADGFFQ